MEVISLRRGDSWAGVRVLVVGFNADGQSAADNLLHLGAEVAIVDPVARTDADEFADLLGVLGAEVVRGSGAPSPDWLSTHSWDLVVASGEAAAGMALDAIRVAYPEVPLISSLDLARQFEPEQVWLVVGAPSAEDSHAAQVAHGAAAMLRAGGVVVAVAGQERSAMELVMEPERYDALVLVITSEALAVSGPLRPQAACVLVAAEGLGAAFADTERACIYRPEDPATEQMVREADVVEGARAIGITIGTPGLSMLGVVEDVLCDRAFVENRQTSAAEICTVADLKHTDPADIEEVLASVALARAYGVALAPIRAAISETF